MSSASRGRVRCDFAVYDGQARLSVLLEAKRRFGTDPSWARAWHAMVVERMAQPIDATVVLVVPDRIYAWRPGAGASADPDLMLDAEPWLRPYFDRLKIPVVEVDPQVFETIVGLWLDDVVQGKLPAGNDTPNARDFLDILRGGEVVRQDAA
ncbi:hypothetical protein WME75_09330 [Sorangium sp. So ce1014]|uniref:hypothetical protein n=1 Tax=Sorangium sp. So ce1014 TaxID=3133326 RepID=UPI003F62B414